MKKIKTFVIILLFLSFLLKFKLNNLQAQKKEEKIDNYIVSTKINNQYKGYIIYGKEKNKCLIKEGITKKVLDNYIGHIENSNWIDDIYGNIILAGHNVENAFGKLYKLKENDIITLCSKNLCNKFQIYKIEMIDISTKNYFYNPKDMKILTLITCTNDVNKRLIITAKKV